MRREVGSITEIAPDVWRVMVSVGHSSTTGKRRRPTKTIRGDRRTAEVALARLLLAAGRLPESDVTLRQYLEDMYLPHVEGRLRARTVDGYRSKLEHHVFDELGDTMLNDLTPYVLDKWIDGVKGSERSRQHVYRVLSAALNVAVRWRLIENNPLKAVEVPKVNGHKKPDVLTPAEARTYIEAFRGHDLEPIVVLALSAGLRRSELAGLRWTDIDFDAGTVSVARGLHDRQGEVIEEAPKSVTSAREVALPAWALELLKPLRQLGPLVVEDGEPMKPWRITREYLRRLAEKKLRRVQFKNLRHSHACLMLDAGVDLYTVSRRLGHSTVAVTEAHYVTPGEQADRAAADALGDLRQLVPSAKSRQDDERKDSTVND